MKKDYEAGLAERRLKEEEVGRWCSHEGFIIVVQPWRCCSRASCPRPCGYGLHVSEELRSSLGIDNNRIQ